MALNLREAQEEYDAVRSAYLAALQCQEYSVSSGGIATSKRNQYIERLRAEMDRCAQEIKRYENDGKGITMTGGYPTW